MTNILQGNPSVFPTDEYMFLLNSLNRYHIVFYKLWSVGKPSFSDEVPTAAVCFDRNGKFLQFIINYQYWSTISEAKKLFIICHECLHLIYDHGSRLLGVNEDLKNYAADLVVNHSLINKYGFIRNEVDPENVFCWIDKFFTPEIIEKNHITENESLETYYKLIKEFCKIEYISSTTVDDHSKSFSIETGDRNKILYESDISNSDARECEVGNNPGGKIILLGRENVKKKKKWETVIKHWSKKYLKDSNKEKIQWAKTARRMSMCHESGLLLPSEVEIEVKDDKKKIDVFFYLDTSGSCVHLARRFFRAAKSLPPEIFDIHLFCFDTKVYETTLESGKLYGFGGTSFTCINASVNSQEKYPKAVFIITDMWASSKPKVTFPDRWHFFSSTSYKGTLPDGAHFYKLSDYE